MTQSIHPMNVQDVAKCMKFKYEVMRMQASYWNTGGGGGGVLELIFAGYVLLASQSRYPIIVYSVAKE